MIEAEEFMIVDLKEARKQISDGKAAREDGVTRSDEGSELG